LAYGSATTAMLPVGRLAVNSADGDFETSKTSPTQEVLQLQIW
jgi:hypothetical protein